MEPSTSPGRDGIAAAVDPPASLLVEVPHFDDRDTEACLDLLTVDAPAAERLLIVSVTEAIGKTHRRWDDRVGKHPAAFSVVSASFVDDADLAERTGTSEASWLTTHEVDDPGDMTGLGVTISGQLEEWADTDEQVVVCLRSLTTMLQYAETDELVRFLAELRSHLDRSDAVAHFHLDPNAVDERTRAALRSVVDGVVVGEEGEPGVDLLE